MKYFIDTEFIEGFKKPIKWLPTIGNFNKPYHSLQLISIGIVCGDGKKYYAISKDFDLEEAWNKWQQRTQCGDRNNIEPREYWIRENVLKSIWKELYQKLKYEIERNWDLVVCDFNYSTIKNLINKYGKSNNQIAKEIKEFCLIGIVDYERISKEKREKEFPHYFPEFYAYFADYDWVVFCSLFGTMMDLPKGFPMYCNDLKQTLDEKEKTYLKSTVINMINSLSEHSNYPKQTNEHNALADAKWNKELYEFLQAI
jgi:hypothetical protein